MELLRGVFRDVQYRHTVKILAWNRHTIFSIFSNFFRFLAIPQHRLENLLFFAEIPKYRHKNGLNTVTDRKMKYLNEKKAQYRDTVKVNPPPYLWRFTYSIRNRTYLFKNSLKFSRKKIMVVFSLFSLINSHSNTNVYLPLSLEAQRWSAQLI